MTTRVRRPPPSSERASLARALIVVLSLIAGFGCAAPTGQLGVAASATESAASRIVPTDAEAIHLSFAPLVRAATPAVVSVTARRSAIGGGADTFFDDPFFRHFFGGRGPFGKSGPRPQREQASLGSGVIVRATGLIVTNRHVIDGADEITIVLGDRREFPAEVVLSDELSDLAFLRIDPGENLPVLPLGDSDKIEVGDLVLAIGNPFGIGQTVTSGIISAAARAAPGGSGDVSFIQTDAAINPGNSGGALVSMTGELIGVNTAIFTRGGGSIGIGFAIPANLVAARLAGIDQGIGTARPWLGADYAPVDTSSAEALGLDRPQGVLIERVHPRAAGAAAGLRPGDVITAVGGVEVNDAPGLNFRLALEPLGHTVPLTVLRRGERLTLDLPLEAAPAEPPADRRTLSGNQPLSGITVANLSPALDQSLGLDPFDSGVAVLSIERGSFATRLGLRPGDAIHAVNGEVVTSTAELERLLGQRARRWVVTVRRGGQLFDLTIS